MGWLDVGLGDFLMLTLLLTDLDAESELINWRLCDGGCLRGGAIHSFFHYRVWEAFAANLPPPTYPAPTSLT